MSEPTVIAYWKARAEKAEAERDEARARFNDKDLCLNGQAPCEDLLAAERTAYTAGWIACRDAAAQEAFDHTCDDGEPLWNGACVAICESIRALTPPPEDKS